jgi:hypothetical protein
VGSPHAHGSTQPQPAHLCAGDAGDIGRHRPVHHWRDRLLRAFPWPERGVRGHCSHSRSCSGTARHTSCGLARRPPSRKEVLVALFAIQAILFALFPLVRGRIEFLAIIIGVALARTRPGPCGRCCCATSSVKASEWRLPRTTVRSSMSASALVRCSPGRRLLSATVSPTTHSCWATPCPSSAPVPFWPRVYVPPRQASTDEASGPGRNEGRERPPSATPATYRRGGHDLRDPIPQREHSRCRNSAPSRAAHERPDMDDCLLDADEHDPRSDAASPGQPSLRDAKRCGPHEPCRRHRPAGGLCTVSAHEPPSGRDRSFLADPGNRTFDGGRAVQLSGIMGLSYGLAPLDQQESTSRVSGC